MRKDLLALFGDFHSRNVADADLAAVHHRGESLRVKRLSGRYVLQVIDGKGVAASIDYSEAGEAMDAMRRAMPMLGSLYLLREHGLLFPDSLNN